MFDISKLKAIKGVVLETAQSEEISANDIKRIRNDIFHMSQSSFALALGVSKKTIEAWECGTNDPSGTAKKLLYLLENNTHLMKQLYNVVDERNEIAPTKYTFECTNEIENVPSLTRSNTFYRLRDNINGTNKLFA
nr:MAG TPA: putative transcriptional regulator [Caudoviricetes sp.]